MDHRQWYAHASWILMAFGGMWMKSFPNYPVRALGFGSILLSGVCIIESVFYDRKEEKMK